MRAEVQAFANKVPSGKTFIFLCKCPQTLYLYLNISVDSVTKPHSAKLQNVSSNKRIDMNPVIKTFVDNGIEWLKQKDILRRPDPNMPADMLDENGTHSNDWKPWKAIPSTVTNSDLEEIETRIGFKLPNSYKQFLKYKHFYDIHTVADYEPYNHLSSNWKEELYERYFNTDLKPFMLDSGFIWFGNFQDWGFLCFDANKKVGEDNEYPIVLIDHETIDQQEVIFKDFIDCLVKNTVTL